MEAFTIYLFKSAVWLTGFAVIYFLFLRNERFFLLKRAYLVAGILISFFFPFIAIHYRVDLSSLTSPVNNSFAVNPSFIDVQQISSIENFDYRYILLFLYMSGVLFFGFRLIMNLRSVYKTICKANIKGKDRVKIIRASEFSHPFSFFNYIFVNPSVNETEVEEIMNHELAHVHQKHWFDLLLAELLCLFQWVNPIAWIYARFIRVNHEFIADEAALRRTSDPAVYRAALLNQMFGSPVISLSNLFNYSLNKKRFDMMKKIITSPYRKMKILLALPVIAIVLYAFATPEYHYAISTDNSVTIAQATVIVSKVVKGTVVNEDGNPLPGATIANSGKSMGTIADLKGYFVLSNVSDEDSLVFSFSGYKTLILKPVFDSDMNIKLMKGTENSSGTLQIRSTETGTTARIAVSPAPLWVIDGVIGERRKDPGLNANDISSVNVLKGETAIDKYGEKGKDGVIEVTTKKKGITYDENKPEEIVVIGYGNQQKTTIYPSKPLYIIDGVISVNQDSPGIDPDDISSITVLKDKKNIDIYGEKAKGGVILITTKDKVGTANYKPAESYQEPATETKSAKGIVYDETGEPLPGTNVIVSGTTIGTSTDSKGQFALTGIPEESSLVFSFVGYKILKLKPDFSNEMAARMVRSTIAIEPVVVIPVTKPVANSKPGKIISPEQEDAKKDEKRAIAEQKPDEKIFVMVEELPSFPGGVSAMKKFISERTKYPEKAVRGKISGDVVVSFVVKSTGKIDAVKVVKPVNPLLDAEAIRVVKSMPDWNPGKQNGKSVNIDYVVPVTFKLK